MAAPMRGLSAVTRKTLLFPVKSKFYCPKRWSAITGNEKVDKTLQDITNGKISGWLQWYEDVVGLTEVREAQNKVIGAERSFQEAQGERRERQKSVSGIQSKMKDIHAQLDKVQRGDEKYLALLTEEYEIIKEEKRLEGELSNLEELERGRFNLLSSAVRESHEKERSRTERTKYWSIIGSACGAFIGILGATLNNYLRNRELKRIVKESAADGAELKVILTELADTTQVQHNHIQEFIVGLKNLIKAPAAEKNRELSPVKLTMSPDSSNDQLETVSKEILTEIQKQDRTMQREMEDIKKLLSGAQAGDKEGTVIYVGPEMEQMLQETESNLEWKIKANALWTVTFIYGAFAISLPILYKIFKGN